MKPVLYYVPVLLFLGRMFHLVPALLKKGSAEALQKTLKE